MAWCVVYAFSVWIKYLHFCTYPCGRLYRQRQSDKTNIQSTKCRRSVQYGSANWIWVGEWLSAIPCFARKFRQRMPCPCGQNANCNVKSIWSIRTYDKHCTKPAFAHARHKNGCCCQQDNSQLNCPLAGKFRSSAHHHGYFANKSSELELALIAHWHAIAIWFGELAVQWTGWHSDTLNSGTFGRCCVCEMCGLSDLFDLVWIIETLGIHLWKMLRMTFYACRMSVLHCDVWLTCWLSRDTRQT